MCVFCGSQWHKTNEKKDMSDAVTSQSIVDVFTSAYPNESSAIGVAAREGDITKLKELLGRGEDYTVKDNRGWYPMHEAAAAGKHDCAKELLHAAAEDCDSNEEILTWVFPPAYDGATPLSLAAQGGHLEVLQLLAPLYKDSDGAATGFAMHRVCENGSSECVRILARRLPDLINCQDRLNGLYPLHITTERQDFASTHIILKHGACPDVRDLEDNKTALHIASFCGDLALVQMLVKVGCTVNVLDDQGCTPLYLAAQCGQTEIVRTLLQNGAVASIGMSMHKSMPFHNFIQVSYPLSVAAEKGHLGVLRQLAPVTPKINTTCSAIILAASNKRNACLEFLLSNGFPTFKSTLSCAVDSPWDYLISQNNSPEFAATVKILLHHNTVFHELGKTEEFLSLKSSLLPLRFSDTHPDILKVFLNAGLMELHCNCQTFPSIKEMIVAYSRIKARFLMAPAPAFYIQSMSFFPNFALCVPFFPFAKFANVQSDCTAPSHMFLSSELVGKAGSLKELCRWSVRCAIIQQNGLITSLHVRSLDLPMILKTFLLYD